MYRTAVGKLLCVALIRADIAYATMQRCSGCECLCGLRRGWMPRNTQDHQRIHCECPWVQHGEHCEDSRHTGLVVWRSRGLCDWPRSVGSAACSFGQCCWKPSWQTKSVCLPTRTLLPLLPLSHRQPASALARRRSMLNCASCMCRILSKWVC